MTTPTADAAYSAARAGLPGDTTAVSHAAQIAQFLGAHGVTPVYAGTQVITADGQGAFEWQSLAADDVDQPVTLPGGTTAVGRVLVPLLPAGNGADLLVSLCADSSGAPGTVIASTRIPASWIAQLAAPGGLDKAGPMGAAAANALYFTGWSSVPWAPPATSATGGLSTAQAAQGGSYLVFAGGVDAASGKSSGTVAVIAWSGGTTVGVTQPGPALPQPLLSGALAATPDALVYAGGVNTTGTAAVQSTVYAASWDPSTGTVGAWSAQAALPHALVSAGAAAYGPADTVYVVGGSTNYAPESAYVTSVYYASVASQQVQAWTAGPPLPVALADPTVAVAGDWLIVAGGFTTGGGGSAGVWYAPISPATGAPGAWQAGPSVPGGLYVEGPAAVSDSGIAWPQALSISTGLVTQDTLTLTWDANGPGPWAHQAGPVAVLNQDQVTGMFPNGDGSYQLFNFQDVAYIAGTVLPVPVISVPLPASGLTSGGTYHVTLRQQGGDLNDYLSVGLDTSALPAAGQYRARGTSGSWTSLGSLSVPLGVFSQTPGGPVLHTWEDSGARITYILRAGASAQVLGLCEATAFGDGTMLAPVTQVTYSGTVPTGTVQLA